MPAKLFLDKFCARQVLGGSFSARHKKSVATPDLDTAKLSQFNQSLSGTIPFTLSLSQSIKPALYLGGTPSQQTGTSPPSCLLLDNRLYIKKCQNLFAYIQFNIKLCMSKTKMSKFFYVFIKKKNINFGILR